MGLRKASVRKQKEEADYKDSVRAVTLGPLPAYTYSPVTKEYTASANGAIPAQDGVTLVLNDSLLLDEQTNQTQNGIVRVTQVGDGGNPFKLKRRVDFDASAKITSGVRIPVEEGTAYGGKEFELTTTVPILLDTTAMDFDIVEGGGFGLKEVAGTRIIGTNDRLLIGENLDISASGDLRIEGDLRLLDADRHFSTTSIPSRTTRVIPTGEQMLYKGPLAVNGVLVVDGVLTPIADDPVTPTSVLDKLSVLMTNNTGLVLRRGQPVYVSGDEEIALAKADAAATAQFFGVIRAQLIVDGETGLIAHVGKATIPSAAQTGTWAAGDRIFVDPATAGKLTNTSPSTIGELIVPVGRCMNTPGGGNASILIEKGPIVLIT
jgi:hypothetical protein